MRPTLVIPVDPMHELGRLNSAISVEAFSMSGVQNALTGFLPLLQDNFERFINSFSTKDPAIQLKSNERDFIKLVSGGQYLAMTSLPAYVPEGLSVHYLDYLVVLVEAVEHCFNNTQQHLNGYSTYLAQMITNREMRETTASHLAKYKEMEVTRLKLVKRLSDCFNGNHSTNATYGDVVSRNAEWQNVFEVLTKATTLINKISRDALHKKAEESNKYLETIIRQIKEGKFELAGPEVTKNLSDGAYHAALELEFFVMVYFRMTTLNKAISDTMNAVTETIKAK